MKRIWLIFGTRPETIKMAPLLPALREAELMAEVAVTGQHRELLDEALTDFGIRPALDMRLMKQAQAPTDVLAGVLQGTAALCRREAPAMVLVHGDTISAYGAALAAFLCRVPVGHVEAGLRTGDLLSPFPEEMCRRAIAPLAALHFAPTAQARDNLLREGVAPGCITVTGNTGIDALALTQRADFAHPALRFAAGRRLVLLTVHRRESQGEPMRRMLRAVRRLAEEYPDVCFYYPVHPSPAVREAAEALQGCPGVMLDRPQSPAVMHNLLSRCYMVMTDSGGLQEEAPYFHKPVLVLRHRTERSEGVAAGCLRLCGDEESRILREAERLLRDPIAYRAMAEAKSPFGDGKASRRIAEAIRRYMDMGSLRGNYLGTAQG